MTDRCRLQLQLCFDCLCASQLLYMVHYHLYPLLKIPKYESTGSAKCHFPTQREPCATSKPPSVPQRFVLGNFKWPFQTLPSPLFVHLILHKISSSKNKQLLQGVLTVMWNAYCFVWITRPACGNIFFFFSYSTHILIVHGIPNVSSWMPKGLQQHLNPLLFVSTGSANLCHKPLLSQKNIPHFKASFFFFFSP